MTTTEPIPHSTPDPAHQPDAYKIPKEPAYVHDLQAATYLSHDAATNNQPLTYAQRSIARRACMYIAFGDQKGEEPFTSQQLSSPAEGSILEHVAGVVRLKNLYEPGGAPRSPISIQERDETHRAAILQMMSLNRFTY